MTSGVGMLILMGKQRAIETPADRSSKQITDVTVVTNDLFLAWNLNLLDHYGRIVRHLALVFQANIYHLAEQYYPLTQSQD